MTNRMRYFIGSFALLLAASLSLYVYTAVVADEITPEESEYRFVALPCWFDADWTATIRCGELTTPAASGAFRLPVVILKDESAQSRPDPVVYLQGGPGAGAELHRDGIKKWLSWMRYASLGRDIILVDTRGTGRSSPALVCEEYNRENQKVLRENTLLADELAASVDVTRRCFDSASARHAALNYHNLSTQHSARDIRALMQQLNYAEWNILGVSYGTRLALEIARQEIAEPHAQKLKSMVLDSVYPAGFGGVQTWPQVLDTAIQTFFRACRAQAECMAALGTSSVRVEQAFMDTLQRLREHPMELSIRRWDGEVPVRLLLNDHRFLSATFAATYDPRDSMKIAEAIQGVASRREALVKPLIEPFINRSMSSDFNSLTFTAIDCADNPLLPETEYLASVAQYPLLQDYTRDQWRYQLCHGLPTEQPLALSPPAVPTLILAGALDPVTPVDWAKAVSAVWSRVQLHVREKVAHSVLGSEACLLHQLGAYYDNPEAAFIGCEE